MKTAAWMLVAIGGGLGLWAIGSRISTDAIGMMVVLIFGVLAGIPAALLVFAAGNRRAPVEDYPGPATAYAAGYSEGYAAGRRLATTFGPVAQPPVIVVQPPLDDDDDDDDDDDIDAYSSAAPFGRRFRITGEVGQ